MLIRPGRSTPSQALSMRYAAISALNLLIATPTIAYAGAKGASTMPGLVSVVDHSIDIRIQEGRLVYGPTAIVLKQGDRLILRCHTETTLHLHLHGYDISSIAAASKPAAFSFVAHATGRFPMAAHASGRSGQRERILFYVEIHPR